MPKVRLPSAAYLGGVYYAAGVHQIPPDVILPKAATVLESGNENENPKPKPKSPPKPKPKKEAETLADITSQEVEDSKPLGPYRQEEEV